MKRFVFGAVFLVVLAACNRTPETASSGGTADTTIVRTIPDTPLDVGLRFSNDLGMNDPGCFACLEPSLRDSVQSLQLSPWEIFGRWRGFDSGGRLTETVTGEDGLNRTSYYCSIARLEELPPVIRLDFVLIDGQWYIEQVESELPRDVIDSLSVQTQASLVLQNPVIRREMRIARMLLDDCEIDHATNWASWISAEQNGADFAEYIMELSSESYATLALSNMRTAAKLQIIQDRATFQIDDVPVELRELIAAWRELAYLKKAVLRANHEAMQNLRQTGTWMVPDTEEETARIAFLESVFYSVDDLVEQNDTLSTVYPVLLTCGNSEPLEHLMVQLDPHQLEQKTENDIGVPIWRALGVDMNGDVDPERVLYWAGDIYLFLGTPTGYSLIWRSWKDYNSDYHGQFGTETSPAGNRSVVLVGNSGEYEYELFLNQDNQPVFERTSISSDTTADIRDDELVESPLLGGDSR
ncbi:hypothetical protein DRQ21_10905 [Candidatus Fermentibacteria bacterium]|nr:MAG: hypothetical protein DRQ21_10905 [Candidatus Fermentibacteria bacterium]